MSSSTDGSRRWMHFHSALQLAIQRAAHKWTFEDFIECFSLWAEEAPDGASSVFNTIANYQESQITVDINNLLKDYDIKENIDTLHQVVLEAQERKARGETRPDAWKEGLQPRGAIRSRIVPVLEAEAERLREMLKKMEDVNTQLQEKMEDDVRHRQENDQKVEQLLSKLHGVYTRFKALPMDEIETWALQTADSTQPVQRA